MKSAESIYDGWYANLENEFPKRFYTAFTGLLRSIQHVLSPKSVVNLLLMRKVDDSARNNYLVRTESRDWIDS